MNKRELVNKVIEQLTAEVEGLFRAARAAHAEATHEQSKAEDKYDTRGLEASYLARGQSRQAAEIGQAIAEFQALPLRDFKLQDPIDLGAFVELNGKRDKSYYFIGPRAGGTEVVQDGKEIMVITPQSPLGQQLLGKKKGDRIKLEAGGGDDLRVAAVA
ncbi:MAG TPA: GreA/GreB family elongation factor [Verrucomicrobiae bacterium]|nr:GreA/GreB family elongation factor [Verrucomicrobiae bacterium]